MIVAAYAGAGKTFFAHQVARAIDLDTMPFSQILPPDDGTNRNYEEEKAAPYHLENPQYPYNYLLEVLKAEREYDYVLIPTNAVVIQALNKMQRSVVLCYPTQEQKEDYRERFLARGNSVDFLEVFVENWEGFLSPFWNQKLGGIHIPLQKGQFLIDAKATIDETALRNQVLPVQESFLEYLEKETQKQRCAKLYLQGLYQNCVYQIRDIEDSEERQFLYEIGRMVYEVQLTVPRVFDEETWKIIETTPRRAIFHTADRSAVLQFWEEYRRHWPAH